jgi:tetratricopeptide (TPR) repeat protein
VRTSQSLQKIQRRLEDIYGLTKKVAQNVENLGVTVNNRFDQLTVLLSGKAHDGSVVLVRQTMPPKPRILYGRDDFVKDVGRLLANDETSRVCILGPGGMGKTSVALAAMEDSSICQKFPKSNRFWVPCVQATSADSLIHILYSSLRITRDTKHPMDDILSELSATDDPRLILFDNFETPNHIPDVIQILLQLAALPHVAILITMRGIAPTHEIKWEIRNLPPVDMDACCSIFTTICPSIKGDPNLEDLIKALYCMPFAVTLMASLGNELQLTAGDLLQEWHRVGTGMISHSEFREGSMDKSISLSVDSKLVTQNPDALTLLAVLSMLPAGTTNKNLDWWAPTLKSKLGALATLRKAALIIDLKPDPKEESVFFVLPVVQSYMKHGKRISQDVQNTVRSACYKFIVEHNSIPGQASFHDDAAALAREETNIQTILLEATAAAAEGQTSSHTEDDTSKPQVETSIDALDALVAFSWYLQFTQTTTEFAEHTIKVARAARQNRHIAEALFCLGCLNEKTSRYELASFYLDAARKHFRTLSTPAGYLRAGECGVILVDVDMFLSATSKVILKDAREAEADFKKSNDISGVTRGKVAMGHAHFHISEHEKSLTCLFEAKKELEKDSRSTSELARCIHLIARNYQYVDRYSDSVEMAKEGEKVAEEAGDEEQLCRIRTTMARSLCHCDKDDEALEVIERTLPFAQRQGPHRIALLLDRFAAICERKKDYPAAIKAFEEAARNFAIVNTAHTINRRRFCLGKVDRLKQLESASRVEETVPRECEDPQQPQ